MNDTKLMRSIAAGEGCALTELMKRHESLVRQRIAKILRDPVAVEDLTQETFLVVWTRADQFRGEASAGAWLGKIATNLSLNHLRSLQRRPTMTTVPLEDESADPYAWIVDPEPGDPSDLAGVAELEQHMREVLAEIPISKRCVQEMVLDGTELRAIAEELAIPLGTVKSRLHYTRKKLAQAWQALQRQREDM